MSTIPKTTILDKVSEVEAASKKASTGKWSAHERSPRSILREYEIRCNQGTLFRSTSYGNMQNDAEFIATANPQAVSEICQALLEAIEVIKLASEQSALEYLETNYICDKDCDPSVGFHIPECCIIVDLKRLRGSARAFLEKVGVK